MFKRTDIVKEKKTEEMVLFEQLPLKKKIEHIWTYYWMVIVGGIIAVIVVFSFVNSMFLNPARQTYVQINFYGRFLDFEQVRELREYLNEYIDASLYTHTVQIENYFVSADFGAEAAQIQRFYANIFARELDMLIFTEPFFDELLESEIFMDLRHVLTEEELEKLEDKLISANYLQNIPEAEYLELEYFPFVIEIREDSRLHYIMEYDGNLYVAVVSNARRLDNIGNMIRQLIEG